MAAISRQPLQTHDNGTYEKHEPQPQNWLLLTPGTWYVEQQKHELTPNFKYVIP